MPHGFPRGNHDKDGMLSADVAARYDRLEADVISLGKDIPFLGIYSAASLTNRPSSVQYGFRSTGVGETGSNVILPLDTLWAEMSVRLKDTMLEVMASADLTSQQQNSALEIMLYSEYSGMAKPPVRLEG